jgi:ABC-type transport system involved in cytochrome c biogenesis permease subunit
VGEHVRETRKPPTAEWVHHRSLLVRYNDRIMPVDRITLFCFQASYAVALMLEFIQLLKPRPVQRLVSLGFGWAGFVAHTLYLFVQGPPLASQFGSTLFLSWILAIFYLYGSIHHKKLAWGVFVLPLVFGLISLAGLFGKPTSDPGDSWWDRLFAVQSENLHLWLVLHIALLLLASVGVCIGFLASVMYLVQAHRLKTKRMPGPRMQLLSLERLEAMNRRALNLAFPLLTGGMLIGLALMRQSMQSRLIESWADPRVVSAFGLWLVFAILLYLRYGFHLRGRRVALLTLLAFPLLLLTLATAHNTAGGGP